MGSFERGNLKLSNEPSHGLIGGELTESYPQCWRSGSFFLRLRFNKYLTVLGVFGLVRKLEFNAF